MTRPKTDSSDGGDGGGGGGDYSKILSEIGELKGEVGKISGQLKGLEGLKEELAEVIKTQKVDFTKILDKHELRMDDIEKSCNECKPQVDMLTRVSGKLTWLILTVLSGILLALMIPSIKCDTRHLSSNSSNSSSQEKKGEVYTPEIPHDNKIKEAKK